MEIAFSEFGTIDHMKLPYDKKKQSNLGYGWVRFSELAVSKLLLHTIKAIHIDGQRVELQSFQSEKDPKCSTEINKNRTNIRKYIKENSVEKFQLNPPDGHLIRKQPPARKSTEAQELYIIRWDCHSVKPNHSLYFSLAYPKPCLDDALDQNLSFRILRPPLCINKDQQIATISGQRNSQSRCLPL